MSVPRKRLLALLAIALPAGLYLLLYLLPANLLLRSPGRFNRNPERLRLAWRSAWTLVPGRVEVRGLRIEGGPRVRWSLAVEEGRGRIDLPALAGRELHVRDFEGRGVAMRALRGTAAGAPPRPAPQRSPRLRTWTVRLDGVRLDDVRVLEYGPLRLEGKGRASGSLRLVAGRELELDVASLDLGGRLLLKDRPAARNVELQAGLRLGPYPPSRHRGAAALDFLSGHIRLRGEVGDLPLLRRAAGSGPALPGRLALDLAVERGTLQPGSRAEIAAAPGTGSEMRITARVAPAAAGPRLELAAGLQGFALRRSSGLPPLLESDRLRVTAVSPEVRLGRLLAAGHSLGAAPAATLAGELAAEGLRLSFPGRRASLAVSADRARGRIDLPALLRREVRLEGVKAEGARLRLTGGAPPGEKPPASGRPPWSARLDGVELQGAAEMELGGFQLDGDLAAGGGLSWSGGRLAIDPVSVALSGGRLRKQGRPVAEGLGLKGEARLAAFAPGQVRGLEILRLVSGRARVEGAIASLGFLRPYLARASWMSLEGDGRLQADLALDAGRLLPGSRFAVRPAKLAAGYLLSRATGEGEMTGAVTRGKGGDTLDVRVLFQRFTVAARDVPGARPHIQGRGLRMAISTRGLDLARPGGDVQARIDLPAADVRDLRFYNAYLPPASGVEIVSGTGRVSFWLEMGTAGFRARGETSLKSPAAVVRLQDLELAGELDLAAKLSSADLRRRRFALDGTRLRLDGVELREIGAEAAAAAPASWWARLELPRATMDLARPLSVTGTVRLSMKDSGLLLALFSRRKRYLRWFSGLLTVEDIEAQGGFRLGQGALVIDPLVAMGRQVELRTRLRLSRDRRRGCLYIRHGRQAVGIELQDGQRDYKLVRPLKWFQTCGPP